MLDYECTEEQFLKNIENFEMTILKDDGIYRHLRFKRKESSSYYFDIVTYPNHLVISGDMGAFVASRLTDMFQFYRTDREYSLKDGRRLAINPSYWAEKIVSGRDEIREFSVDTLKRVAIECIESRLYDDDDWTEEQIQHLKNDVLKSIDYTDSDSVRMYDMMSEYEYYKDGVCDSPNFEFTDWWDYHSSCEAYTFHYIWKCYAIAYAVQEYDKFKQGEQEIE